MVGPTPRQSVLISVSGPDRPGIMAALTAIVAKAKLDILDLEQVVVQGLLSLSIVLDYPENEARGQPVLKDLLFAAKEMGLDLDFKVLPAFEEQEIAPRHISILTLIGQGNIGAAVIAKITQVISAEGFNIESIQRLGHVSTRCLEMVLSTEESGGSPILRSALLPVSREFGVDIALQPDNIFRKMKRLVVFDLDSTLIQTEVIDELAAVMGVAEPVRAITARAMEGKLDFKESLARRVALLEGMEEEKLEAVYRTLPFTPGAEELIRILKRMGFRTAIISGGFTYFSERIKLHLGLDYAFANELEIVEGRLTGRVNEPVIDGMRKAEILEEIAEAENILLDQVIAIGDGANDLPMLNKAGLGIAFNAKAAVREAAEHSLNQPHLDSILFLLGITQSEMAVLRREG